MFVVPSREIAKNRTRDERFKPVSEHRLSSCWGVRLKQTKTVVHRVQIKTLRSLAYTRTYAQKALLPARTCLRSLPCKPRPRPRGSCWFCSNSPVAGVTGWGRVRHLETKSKESETRNKYCGATGNLWRLRKRTRQGKTESSATDRPNPTELLSRPFSPHQQAKRSSLSSMPQGRGTATEATKGNGAVCPQTPWSDGVFTSRGRLTAEGSMQVQNTATAPADQRPSV